jgi:hypothetical protein
METVETQTRIDGCPELKVTAFETQLMTEGYRRPVPTLSLEAAIVATAVDHQGTNLPRSIQSSIGYSLGNRPLRIW